MIFFCYFLITFRDESRSLLSLDVGGGHRKNRIGVAATPKCKESSYWKHKGKVEFGGLDHEFFYHHAFYVD